MGDAEREAEAIRLWERYGVLQYSGGPSLSSRTDRRVRALSRLVLEEVEREREANCKAIRAACAMCAGTGSVPDSPSPGYVASTECEYCGRPIAAIRSRRAPQEAPDAR